MDAKEISEKISALVAPLLAERGLDLVETVFRREGGRWILRVTIDRPGGVTLDECGKVSKDLAVHLDVEDIIPIRYYLEVSSPGLDRPLRDEKDFLRFKGRLALIKLREAREGEYKIRGTLEGLEDGKVLIRDEKSGERVEIPLEGISSARLDFDF